MAVKEANSKKLFAETVDPLDYKTKDERHKSIQQFSIKNDDKFKTKMWNSCLRECAFYFDNPTMKQKKATKDNLQLKFDPIFQSGWKAPMKNRAELLNWVCNERNDWMTSQGSEEPLENCNIHHLVGKYGPDYETLKEKIGYVKGLFDE